MKDIESEGARNPNELIKSAQKELRTALKLHSDAIKGLESNALDRAEKNEELILSTVAMTFQSGAITIEREIRDKNEKQLQDLGKAIDDALSERQKMIEKLIHLTSQGLQIGLTSVVINIVLVASPLIVTLFPSILSSTEARNFIVILVIAFGILRFVFEATEFVRSKRLSNIIHSEELRKADTAVKEKINKLRDIRLAP